MNPLPPIEDEYHDVLGKAMRGLDMNTSELADAAGMTTVECEALLSGDFSEEGTRSIAPVLGLNPNCLVNLARGAAEPETTLPEGVKLHNAPFPVPGYAAMTVNSYSIHPPGDPASVALIDAGSGFESLSNANHCAASSAWKLFLTHTHPDHVVHYDQLAQKTANNYAPAAEPYEAALPVREGDHFELGSWHLTAIETPGHSPGGTSYLLEGASQPVVFAGDALFCGSIGKVNSGYKSALDLIREKILGLPDNTIVCPGHGPPTTVAFEKERNPFFA
ncbi:MBL fold metallo-hydrolase [Coraliomargarita sinensis]|uniref:MBL fold metallo-hydrolase n=1 Tax=Coraliomargarita sinensis TaxID=2174842 RepID=A0A317ZIY9_9BACT|nr:MBL fold metallo-hydrolase [Coraliomargarita sinensis]PXA04193.1 MBL fold metallo-hydrolase [Coraliomargarita sinensis]